MDKNIYDWNLAAEELAIESTAILSRPQHDFRIMDETLRDGIQAPIIKKPIFEEKKILIESMRAAGIDLATIGFPGASTIAEDQCRTLAKVIAEDKRPFDICLSGRTNYSDIHAILNVANGAGVAVEAYLFVAVSPIRQYVEGWSLETVLSNITESAKICRREGQNFVLVLEDTLRCPPSLLEGIYKIVTDEGITRVVICDTVGCASPLGAFNIINWTKNTLKKLGSCASLDWHGHNDRGMALINSLVAVSQGCSRVHGTILGVGERAGNASLDQIIVNLYLLGWKTFDLKALRSYAEAASQFLAVDIPENYPAFGAGVFQTSAGVHASAIYKAHKLQDEKVKDIIYSSIPAEVLGRKQEIKIDSSSGVSNVLYWLAERNLEADTDTIHRILSTAKRLDSPLDDIQVSKLIVGEL